MALLVVDTTTGAWRHVVAYAKDRRAELADECCSVATSGDRRAELAARIAELDELLRAPESTQLTAVMHGNGPTPRMY